MRVVISGVAGVGKSTVLELVRKKTNYDIINFGTLMFEMARNIDLVKDRDELRKLPVDTQINLQKKASAAIGKMNNGYNGHTQDNKDTRRLSAWPSGMGYQGTEGVSILSDRGRPRADTGRGATLYSSRKEGTSILRKI